MKVPKKSNIGNCSQWALLSLFGFIFGDVQNEVKVVP